MLLKLLLEGVTSEMLPQNFGLSQGIHKASLTLPGGEFSAF